jgi:hypothetical protein
LQAKKEAKLALAQHGLIKGVDTKSATFKMPSTDQLSRKRVDPLQLEVLYPCHALITHIHHAARILDTHTLYDTGSRQKKDVERGKISDGASWKRG